MEKEKSSNTGLKIALIVFIVISLLLGAYIVYDKVLLDSEESDDINNNNNNNNTNFVCEKTVITAEEFIDEIMNTENVFGEENECETYTVNYNKISYISYVNQETGSTSRIINNTKILYDGKQINKDLSYDGPGFGDVKAYNLNDNNNQLFIITLLYVPVPSTPSTYIIAFDQDGNIKLDNSLENTSVSINQDELTLTYSYTHFNGGTCRWEDLDKDEIATSDIIYKYNKGNLEEISKKQVTYGELPDCD